MRRGLIWLLVAALGGVAVTGIAAGESSPAEAPGPAGAPAPTANDSVQVARGQRLFGEVCSSCHGFDGSGVPGQGPSLRGAGAAAADFYLRTGRMPLSAPGAEPQRGPPAFDEEKIADLTAYVGSLGGPPVPEVDPTSGSVSEGYTEFRSSCAGCHAITAKGGVVVGGEVPSLDHSTPEQVAEAVRIGPYLMPRFSEAQISDAEVDSLARYVQLTQGPDNRGGWGIGNIGPVPEGAVAWLAAIGALLLIARLIGERMDRPGADGDG